MKLFGLIGYPLTHSFSKKYFTEKFEQEGIKDCRYELFEIAQVAQLPEVLKSNPDLCGLNVTIPHKENVISMLDAIDPAAKAIGAVNVIKIVQGKLTGYNSDYYGFKESLLRFVGNTQGLQALILGTGGASKATRAALKDMNIPYLEVSRSPAEGMLAYEALDEKIIQAYSLIINTTPVGMYPKTEICPEIPYAYLSRKHYLFDLVYNPLETLFMQKGKVQGAQVKNGLEMLHLQAEKAWEIWNKE